MNKVEWISLSKELLSFAGAIFTLWVAYLGYKERNRRVRNHKEDIFEIDLHTEITSYSSIHSLDIVKSALSYHSRMKPVKFIGELVYWGSFCFFIGVLASTDIDAYPKVVTESEETIFWIVNFIFYVLVWLVVLYVSNKIQRYLSKKLFSSLEQKINRANRILPREERVELASIMKMLGLDDDMNKQKVRMLISSLES